MDPSKVRPLPRITDITINFKYPYDEDPNQLISELGISFPSGYDLSRWEAEGDAFFTGPKCPHLNLAETVDQLFTRLLGAPPDYVVQGWIEISLENS